jgi:hypothetical protein
MASAVDICNLALAHIGDEATVSSIDPADGSAQASLCARFYPIARDALFAKFAWSWAQKRATLAELTTAPAEWGFAYALPADYNRALEVIDASGQRVDYVVEVDEDGVSAIYTNLEDAVLRYVANVTDTSKFSPLFVSALSWLLASYLAGPITKDMKIKESAYKVHAFELSEAMAADANARQLEDFLADEHKPDWIADR